MLKWIALAAAMSMAGLAPAGAQTLAPADLARQFEEIAFRPQDAGSAAPTGRRFLRGPRPMEISFTAHDKEPAAARRLAGVLQGLGAILGEGAGVRIKVTPRRRSFDVVGLRESEFEATASRLGEFDPTYLTAFGFARGIKKEGCFFYSLLTEDGRIIGGRVMVALDRPPERREACIYRGVLYLMGLEGDTRRPTGVFTGLADFRGLTARNLAVIRMAQDPRLKPGMALAEARPLLRAIAADAIAD